MSIFLGSFRVQLPDSAALRIIGGMLTDERVAAELALKFRLREHGITSVETEVFLAEADWNRRYPNDLHAKRISAVLQTQGQISFLHYRLLLPARRQSGLADERNVQISRTVEFTPNSAGPPDKLGWLFDGSLGKNCFAILDAATIPNLPDLLSTSDQQFDCLFTGKAREDLSNVAPWILRLNPASRFAQRLWIQGNASWQMGGKFRGLLLSSDDDLAQVIRHFRRLTRVRRADADEWMYFRFYDPHTIAAIAPHLTQEEAISILGNYVIAGVDGFESTTFRVNEAVDPLKTPPRPFVLRNAHIRAMAEYGGRQFSRLLEQDVREERPDLPVDMVQRLVTSGLDLCADVGLQQKDSIAGYVLLSAHLGADFPLRHPPLASIVDPLRSERERKTLIHASLKGI